MADHDFVDRIRRHAGASQRSARRGRTELGRMRVAQRAAAYRPIVRVRAAPTTKTSGKDIGRMIAFAGHRTRTRRRA